MSISSKILKAGAIGFAGILAASSASAATLDLTGGGSGMVNGATFFTLENHDVPTGTGVFEPFLRLQANGNAVIEEGYNTDRSPVPAVQFDEKVGVWTHSIQLSDIPLIGGFYQFALDLGEPANNTSLISLDMLQLFKTGDSDIFGATYNAANQAAPFGVDAMKLWDLDGPADNLVLLDYLLVGSGNGRADMAFFVPESYFATALINDYIVLYSKFGVNVGAHGTFEEWAALGDITPISLPPAALMLLAAFAGLGFVGRKRMTGAAA